MDKYTNSYSLTYLSIEECRYSHIFAYFLEGTDRLLVPSTTEGCVNFL